MSKLLLDTVPNIDAVSVINANFDKIEQEVQNKILYRQNPSGEPNTLESDIDCNGKVLYNVGGILKDEALPANFVSLVVNSSNAEHTALVNVQLLVDWIFQSEFGFKSMKQNAYTGASSVTPFDNGRVHYKTDATAVTVPNTLATEFMTTIINFNDNPMSLTFTSGVAYQQGSSDPTGKSAWTVFPRNSVNIVKVANGSWLLSGMVSPA